MFCLEMSPTVAIPGSGAGGRTPRATAIFSYWQGHGEGLGLFKA